MDFEGDLEIAAKKPIWRKLLLNLSAKESKIEVYHAVALLDGGAVDEGSRLIEAWQREKRGCGRFDFPGGECICPPLPSVSIEKLWVGAAAFFFSPGPRASARENIRKGSLS